MTAPSNNNLHFQTNDVLCNPQNSVNPDSKLLMLYTPLISFTLRSPIQFLVLKGTDPFQRFELVVEIRYRVIPTFITDL